MKKALIISAFLVSLLLLLVVWRLWQRASKPAVTAGAAPATVVELDTVVRKKMDFQLDQVGNVEAQQNVDILSRTAGPITELRVREGDHVVKGQLLVRIDPLPLRPRFSRRVAAWPQPGPTIMSNFRNEN